MIQCHLRESNDTSSKSIEPSHQDCMQWLTKEHTNMPEKTLKWALDCNAQVSKTSSQRMGFPYEITYKVIKLWQGLNVTNSLQVLIMKVQKQYKP